MCFIAFTFINHLRLLTGLQYPAIAKGLDQMQLSHIEDKKADNGFYLRANIGEAQRAIIDALKLKTPNDTTPQLAINQYFMK